MTLLGVGWHYTPRHTRERLLGFIGIVSRGNVGDVKTAIGDLILPEDPEERREILIGELKKNLRELRAQAGEGEAAADASGVQASAIAAASTGELIAASEDIIKELEAANGDKSVGGTIIERIIDRALPAQSVECKQ